MRCRYILPDELAERLKNLVEMPMKWSGFLSLIVGFVVAIAVLAGVSLVGVRFFLGKLTAPPPRPVFANENSKQTPAKVSVATQPKPQPVAQPSPTPKPTSPPGSYPARVVSPIGLVLRDSPATEAGQIGGIDFNERVIVLEQSSDGDWQRVQVENDTSRQGWIKAGNTEKVSQ